MMLFCFDHVILTVHTTKMASIRDTDCYVFGNNLEAILEALEEDDDLNVIYVILLTRQVFLT